MSLGELDEGARAERENCRLARRAGVDGRRFGRATAKQAGDGAERRLDPEADETKPHRRVIVRS